VSNPVSNVTIAVAGANVTQQRQNLGETRIRGLQNDVEYRLGGSFKVTAAYLYNQAKVTDGGASNAALVGNFLPQVPAHRGSLRVVYTNPRVFTVSADVLFMGRQFDDDQNTRGIPAAALAEAGVDVTTEAGLPGYRIVDFTASRGIGRYVDVFFGAQNVFDTEYFVGTLPTTIGSPRLVNVGVRVKFSGR
jgi:outer membrane receptor protein involved in Fe transport